MDAKTDKEERVIALKLMVGGEELTVVEIESILEDMEARNTIIVGGDFNTITDKD